MTYQIKCNGKQLCTELTRRQAVNAIQGLLKRALSSGLSPRLRSQKKDYILTVSNGMTYEMRAA